VAAPDPPDHERAFPLPHQQEPASPYRERIRPPASTAAAGKPRIVGTRPDPPGRLGSVTPPDAPTPVGFLDGPLRVLRAPLAFMGDHPHLLGLILLIALGLLVSCWGRSIARGPYVD